MFIYRQKQKGMVLICAVAILAVLSIMATSFVRMMTLNLQAAKNHLNYVDAKFAAIAGIEAAKAKMWQYMLTNKWDATTGNPNPIVSTQNYKTKKKMKDPDDRSDLFWYPPYKDSTNKKYKNLETACREKQNISLINSSIGSDNTNPFSYSGVVGRKYDDDNKFGRYEYNGNTYALKIQDNQGRLNLNSHKPYNDSSHNSKSNQVINTIIKCLAIQCGLNSVVDKNGNTFDATEAIANTLRPQGPTIKTLSSMLEVEGYIDSIVPDTNDEQIAKKLNFLNNVCITSVLDSNCYALANPSSDAELRLNQYINNLNTEYYREYRSPININTVSVELMAALIQAIHSQTYVYMPTSSSGIYTNKEKNFIGPLTTETIYPYHVLYYEVSFINNASNIAKFLLYNSTNDSNIKPENRQYFHSIPELESHLQGCSAYFPNNPHSKDEDDPYYDFFNSIWINICADTLKANFNPNVRENFFNPDFVYMQYVTKSNLHNGTTPSYSTEVCFETYGHIDIQSIGKITANNKNLVVASSVMQESIGFSSITSLTTYNDFNDNETSNGNVFPYNTEQACIENRQNSLGYIQAHFMENAITSCPSLCHNTHDGIMMKEIYSGNNILDTPEYRTSSTDFSQFNLPDNYYNHESSEDDPSINPAYIYEQSGSISFWFKPTEDGHSPLFCSLFSASYLNPTNKQYIPAHIDIKNGYDKDGYPIPKTYKDGIQMFAYKNTNQQLVVSRIFFCGYYNGSTYEGLGKEDIGINLDVTPNFLPGTAESGIHRKYARVDSIISLKNIWWCENEWNCLEISWNDSTGDLTATLTFDSNDKRTGTVYHRGFENTISKPQFCVLNENNPDLFNRIQINGIARSQYSKTSNPDGRLFILEENLHLPGNTTMNHLRKGESQVNRGVPSYTYNVKMPLNIKNGKDDPNKNPFLNTNLKPETTWGYIGGLTWIAYPESPATGEQYKIRSSIVDYANSSAQVTTSVHTSKLALNNHSIPYSFPANRSIIRTSDGDQNLQCTIILRSVEVHPTILDSISLQILYPYTVSSSILQ